MLISLILAIILSEFLITYFNNMVNRNLEINFQNNPPLIILLIFLSISLALLTGIYPAIILSNFKFSLN